ncbi:DNA mismatch repair protein MutH [Staphylococcus cohnii]|uniref:Sau3AI family type II restriction endonuclease n=1 Tax=Staphylococcus TaxID=1279 RepID=UPI0007D93B2E|nr:MULTISPECIES: Sau3AI family type II restriction endonuclease [Staphylococcus]MCQ9294214.1 Sau3AI family type II restriction endonuclease [Staphylococcus cohnii]OAO20299.1 DNA mismatch repair protein MutH [Staphylococcus cohnii]PTF06530.1 DNA mismatch repair protein MutH [Staphylococcus cohnii]PTF39733.1 DNA mismatch repair protein MutH [Staphylococcus cohnii]PTG39516.1 DNA mismatch repair protein MutH [Staphylococcus cohnii]
MTEYKTKQQVHNRAKEAVGKTLMELNDGIPISGTKSSAGDAFETWFGKQKDSDSRPDMEEAGVELKATPIKKLKNGQYSSKERLVLNIINYDKVVKENFEESSFLNKNGTIELAFYEHDKELKQDEWLIKEAILYEMKHNPVDYEVIKQDWEIIHEYIQNGKAHELSEGLTNYLSPCTKGASSKSVRTQPFSDIKAKQRAFSFKSGYMTSLLRKYVLGDEQIDSIIKDKFEIKAKSIEDIVIEKFQPYIGWTIDELCEHFNIKKGAYNLNYRLASAILNLKGKITKNNPFPEVEEFEKSSIVVKTVKFDENNRNKESMSFGAFKFEELANEQWIDEDGLPSAQWHNFLLESRFLFFVVKTENEMDVFKGIKFFSMPEEDIEGPIKKMWLDTVDKIKTGVTLEAVPDKGTKDGWRINNNFISKSDKLICHVRPHEQKRDYRKNGLCADKLPHPAKWINKPESDDYSNEWMTKQSFWINNDYIKKQVEELL